MSNADIRKAHKLLDYVSQGRAVLDDELKLLRSFLPELPKQKTLEEITEHVRDAWVGASCNEWAGNSYNTEITLESWLVELYEQLQVLKDTPATVTELPAGMRLADHEEYGRCVVSPEKDIFGRYFAFHLDNWNLAGAACHYVSLDALTFIDAEPAKPAHPEFLETEADYAAAPEGTIVALDGSGTIWLKKFGGWRNTAGDHGVESACIALDSRRVLRWGWGE